MTEEEWFASVDPTAMLAVFQTRLIQAYSVWSHEAPARFGVSDRKLRLLACACWRACPPEGLSLDWLEALQQLEEVTEGKRETFAWPSQEFICATYGITNLLRHLSGLWVGMNQSAEQRAKNAAKCADLLRHIVGNPWRPVAPLWSSCPGCKDDPQFATSDMCRTCDGKGKYGAPSWLTPSITALAEQLYDGEPIAFALHDALVEEGHATFAEHFREAEHPKGCWALDLILGKE